MTYKCSSKVCALIAVYCDKNGETKKYVQNFGPLFMARDKSTDTSVAYPGILFGGGGSNKFS